MADYFVHLWVLFPVGTAENTELALDLYRLFEEDLERDEEGPVGFSAISGMDGDASGVWLSSNGDGDPEHVIAFAKRCGKALGLTGRWGFCWSLTRSRPRLDGFGGGAHVLDLATGDSVNWIDCEHWLATQLAD